MVEQEGKSNVTVSLELLCIVPMVWPGMFWKLDLLCPLFGPRNRRAPLHWCAQFQGERTWEGFPFYFFPGASRVPSSQLQAEPTISD